MADINRVVLKIGTSVLLDEDGRISRARADDFARQIKAVTDRSVEVIVVSSGAIACGMETIGPEEEAQGDGEEAGPRVRGADRAHAHVHGRLRRASGLRQARYS